MPASYFLHPGDVVLAERGDCLETLLGSCISAILTNPRRTVAGMCHVVYAGAEACCSGKGTSCSENALDAVYSGLLSRSVQPSTCEAFVYGGGNMFPWLSNSAHPGQRNARAVLERLTRGGIRVVQHDIGGSTYRRVRWLVGAGLPEITSVPIHTRPAIEGSGRVRAAAG